MVLRIGQLSKLFLISDAPTRKRPAKSQLLIAPRPLRLWAALLHTACVANLVRKKITIILITSLMQLALLSSACSRQTEPEPVVIHVYRDPAATEIESALRSVGARHLKNSHGQAVMIATIEPKSYADGLEALGNQYHPELVIFDSSEDGKKMKVEFPLQSVVQVGTKQFYLVIPPWVPGEQRQTAELVLTEFRRALQNTD